MSTDEEPQPDDSVALARVAIRVGSWMQLVLSGGGLVRICGLFIVALDYRAGLKVVIGELGVRQSPSNQLQIPEYCCRFCSSLSSHSLRIGWTCLGTPASLCSRMCAPQASWWYPALLVRFPALVRRIHVAE
jgi:hypothetical protein